MRFKNLTCRYGPAALLCLALAGCSQSSQQARSGEPFRWGGPKNIAMLPIVAEDKGFFRDAGLQTKPVYLQTGKMAMDAVVSGDLDAGIIVETNIAFIGYQPGADVRVISEVMRKHDDAIVARTDQGVRKPTDLYGKSVAIVPATTSQRFADRFVDFYKLDRSRIQFVNSTAPGIQAGLLNGETVAGAIWEPFRYNLQKSLGPKLVQFHDLNIYTAYGLVAMRAATIGRDHVRAEQFLRGLIRAQQYVSDHQQESIAILAKELGMEAPVLAAIWNEYELNVALDPGLQSVFEDAGRWAKRAQPALASAPAPSFAGVIDPSVLRSAQAAGLAQ